MFLLLANTALAALPVTPARAEAQAIATIRIERPAIASSRAWEDSPKGSRREVIRRDERGQPLLLRLIDYQ
jgi:hypothetical protein